VLIGGLGVRLCVISRICSGEKEQQDLFAFFRFPRTFGLST